MNRTMTMALIVLSLSGCATKRYGRLTPLSGAEMTTYTCREIAIELAKVEAFEDSIKTGSQTNVASVAGFLGDFGIGNSMEKGSAEKSAVERRQQLRKLESEKGCANLPPAASASPAS